jgi:hypothetical protein
MASSTSARKRSATTQSSRTASKRRRMEAIGGDSDVDSRDSSDDHMRYSPRLKSDGSHDNFDGELSSSRDESLESGDELDDSDASDSTKIWSDP